MDMDCAYRMSRAFAAAALVALMALAAPLRAQPAGQSVVSRLEYPRSVAVCEPTQPASPTADQRSGRRFAAHATVFARRGDAWELRFRVHVPDAGLLPLGRRVARFIGLLWGLADARFGTLNARLRAGCADVYLCRDGDGGAEQTRESIYLYDVMAPRSDLEWARTVAHEYGHYLLPGPSGFKEPEPWANGLLGERLFLGWLHDELRAGKLPEADAAPLTAPAAAEYRAKQVEPLIARVMNAGPDRQELAGTDKSAMDEAIALLLYADAVHGSRAIPSMLEWLPVRSARQPSGGDFLAAYEAWLRSAALIRLRLPAGAVVRAYVPAGSYRVRADAGPQPTITVHGCTVVKQADGVMVHAATSGWRQVRCGSQAKPAEGDGRVAQGEVELVWVRQVTRR